MLQDLTAGWEAFSDDLKRFGGELVELYAVASQFDAVAIVDFEDPAAVLAFTLTATAQGQYAEALPVFTQEEVARAEAVARRAASAFREEAARAIDEASKTGYTQDEP